jgi:hypothetical protein
LSFRITLQTDKVMHLIQQFPYLCHIISPYL